VSETCESCGVEFTPKRAWQSYCSRRCSNRDAQRRARGGKCADTKPQECRDTAPSVSQPPKCDNGRQIRDGKCLTALLWARGPIRSGGQRPDWYLYDVEFEGEPIVTGSADAECAAARVLLARGITGGLTFLHSVTGKPRSIINIEKAVQLTVRDGNRQGPMFVKWRPFDVNSSPLLRGKRHEQLDHNQRARQRRLDWCQKFEDRVVNPLLDSNWASPASKHGVHWLFVELRDRACEGNGKEVKRLATEIFDHWNEQVTRFHERAAEQEAKELLQRTLDGGGSDG
jgi:hypothetical protein